MKYYMHDLICDVINYCASRFAMGKINGIHSLIERNNAKGSAYSICIM